jgi:hypothetical protein
MKKLHLLKTVFLLCALVVGSLNGWAAVVSGTTYNTLSTSSLPTGWSGSDDSGTSYIKLTASSHYIQTSNFAQNGFTNITLRARKFNGPSADQALITVSWYDSSTSAETVLGTIAPSSTTLSDYNISSPANPTGNTTGYVKIQCKGASSSKGSGVSQVTITYTTPSAAVATPTFSIAAGSYTSTQSVELACETEGATIYYTKGDNPADPTDASTEYTGTAITVDATTTIKAIAKKGSDYSNVATATYAILDHAGTEADPYAVADARNAIDVNLGVSEVYATGIVSEIVTAYNTTYKNISFNISADGLTTSAQLQAFRCKKGEGGSAPDVADIQVGDVVIVKGNLEKSGSTYRFAQDNVLISLDHPTTPLIIVTPSSLTGFTYGVGSGPSAAQTFSVEGSNLTANISLSLGESNYEMSLTEGSGYTNSLTLTQTAGVVAATTIYVRLKAGLAVNASYEGTVSLTSTGATAKAVSLAGSVTQPNFSWNLSTNSYDASPTEDEVTWSGSYASMKNQKGSSSSAANNYLGGDANNRTSTRFYGNQILTITPKSGYRIISIVFTATSDSYATTLKNSTWSNATATASSTTVTVTPTNGALPISATASGACGFTAVKVYYETAASVTLTPAKTYTTLTSSHALDFTSVSSDLKAYIATEVSGVNVQMTPVKKVPAGTGLVLKATTPGSAVNVPVFDGTSPDDVSSNKMAGSATETIAIAANGGYILSSGIFQPASAGTLAAGKAYLNIAVSSARELVMNFDEDETTVVADVRSKIADGRSEYFNLAGQRVAQPTKGLYIVNGKKVILK